MSKKDGSRPTVLEFQISPPKEVIPTKDNDRKTRPYILPDFSIKLQEISSPEIENPDQVGNPDQAHRLVFRPTRRVFVLSDCPDIPLSDKKTQQMPVLKPSDGCGQYCDEPPLVPITVPYPSEPLPSVNQPFTYPSALSSGRQTSLQGYLVIPTQQPLRTHAPVVVTPAKFIVPEEPLPLKRYFWDQVTDDWYRLKRNFLRWIMSFFRLIIKPFLPKYYN